VEESSNRPIDPVVFSTARLDLLTNGEFAGYATGFFYLRDERLYLVTNRHVLAGDDLQPRADSANIRLHTTANVYDNDDFPISLLTPGGSPAWKLAPGPADIAVVPLGRDAFQSSSHITWFTPDMFFPRDYVLDPGEDAFLMGYPYSLRDEPTNLPIFRKAMVATVYGVSFNGAPCFLTDGHFHDGMSGGPVIVKPRPAWRDVRGESHTTAEGLHFLLGVHSGLQRIFLAGDEEDEGVDVALGRAWYPDAIDRAIETA
jgi:Trypsin-like peptidase domain